MASPIFTQFDTGSSARHRYETGDTNVNTWKPSAGATSEKDIHEGTHGPHKSRIANRLDPRVDSDLDRGTKSETATATGTQNSNRGFQGHTDRSRSPR